MVLAVAVGVGSLTGVRGFSRSFRHMLLREARTLMAGDLTARVFGLPTPEQEAAFCAASTRAACAAPGSPKPSPWPSSAATPDPLLISVKAVDPAAYPFYGVVKLEPAAAACARPSTRRSVVVSDDLLLRLNVRTGDTLRIGGQDFRIAGVMAVRTGPHDRQPQRRARA